MNPLALRFFFFFFECGQRELGSNLDWMHRWIRSVELRNSGVAHRPAHYRDLVMGQEIWLFNVVWQRKTHYLLLPFMISEPPPPPDSFVQQQRESCHLVTPQFAIRWTAKLHNDTSACSLWCCSTILKRGETVRELVHISRGYLVLTP